MKRWGVWLVLFLSLGFNLGLVVSRLTERSAASRAERPAQASNDQPVPVASAASTEGDAEENADEASADQGPRQVPRWLERIIVRVADELGLLGAERERFFDLQREYFRRTIQARKIQRRSEFEVRRLLVSGRAERTEVEEALGRVVSAQGEVEQAFLDHYFAARELLDEHQMLRYQHFLGQLRRASQEMARGEIERLEARHGESNRRRRPGRTPERRP